MNRQISRLLASLVLLVTVVFIGCDLGTYDKRFKERNNPAAQAPSADEDPADEDPAEEESGDSE